MQPYISLLVHSSNREDAAVRRFVNWIVFLIILLALIPAYGIVIKLIDSLSIFEVITILVYPFLIAYVISMYSTKRIENTLGIAKIDIKMAINELSKRLLHGKIVYHGTKFKVPNTNSFWTNLLNGAQNRFYLVGKSNKSWIDKSDDQSRELGQAIVRILENGGQVKILSSEDEEIVSSTKKFLERYVFDQIQKKSSRIRSKLLQDIDNRFDYICCSGVNYNAVISDNKLLLMPNMNTGDFRDESMVLEIDRQFNPHEFDNYLGDIHRLFAMEASRLRLTSDGLVWRGCGEAVSNGNE